MSLNPRYAPVLFSGLVSAIMVGVVSAVVLLLNQGFPSDFIYRWMKSFATTWSVAFPALLVVAPRVRRFVAKVTAPRSP